MRPRRGRAASLLLLGALVAGAPSAPTRAAGEPDVTAFLARLARAGSGTRTLQGRFVQKKRLALFRNEVATRGQLTYSRPDKLRWETLAPDDSVLLVLGLRAELRLPGEAARQLDLRTDRTLGPLVQQLFVWLGLREGSGVAEAYRLSLAATGSTWTLTLLPRDPALKRHLVRVTVSFGADLLPSRLELLQPNGDRTAVEFSELRRNQEVPASRFR